MQIEAVDDDVELASRAADIVGEAVRRKPDARLGLPTGNTPLGAYAEIARRAAAGDTHFSAATGYAVDEFAGVSRDTPGTNSYFFRRHFGVRLRALHIPNPGARDPGQHIEAFAEMIRRDGGLDLCVLGIGRNGHIAFNEPGSAVDSPARVVTLDASSRAAHGASFGSIDRVPERGMTLGVADLMASGAILVMAHGAHKAGIVRAAIEGPQTADVPASWLQRHGDVTWLLDRAAASMLSS